MTDSSQTIMPTYPGKAPGEHRNQHAFAAIEEDGSVVTWGLDAYGGDSSSVADELDADGTPEVTQVFSTSKAFAALREDGSIVTWGSHNNGGDSSSVADELDADGSPSVTRVFSTAEDLGDSAFAALREDGSVVTWGDFSGGNSSSVADEIDASSGTPAVTQVFSMAEAFAALREDGSVVSWGSYADMSSSIADELDADGSPAVTQVFSTNEAFAALRKDGSVVTWGEGRSGGNSSVSKTTGSGDYQIRSVADELDADGTPAVTQVFSTGPSTGGSAFAALREDGSVVTWGENDRGGDSLTGYGTKSSVADELDADGTPAVTQVFSTVRAFAALREDGSVVTWGAAPRGGDSSSVADELDADGSPAVTQVFSTNEAFAALRKDGSVVTWGEGRSGGNSSVSKTTGSGDYQIRSVADELDADGTPAVTQVFSTGPSTGGSAFAALREDGSVVTWGENDRGGDSLTGYGTKSSVADELDADGTPAVTQVFSTAGAFAALREDGSVVAWGSHLSGGNPSFYIKDAIDANGTPAVTQVFSTSTAFAALREDGSIVTWGDGTNGGRSASVADELSSGVVTIASPFTSVGNDQVNGPDNVYVPDTLDLEYAARVVAYQRNGENGEYNLPDGYRLEDPIDTDNGFLAVPIVADNGEPILAVRGTQDVADVLTDLDPEGVGAGQVTAARPSLVQWLAEHPNAHITGHSLGGAQAQMIAAEANAGTYGSMADIASVTTFNSAGVSEENASKFDPTSVDRVSHFVVSGDVPECQPESRQQPS